MEECFCLNYWKMFLSSFSTQILLLAPNQTASDKIIIVYTQNDEVIFSWNSDLCSKLKSNWHFTTWSINVSRRSRVFRNPHMLVLLWETTIFITYPKSSESFNEMFDMGLHLIGCYHVKPISFIICHSFFHTHTHRQSSTTNQFVFVLILYLSYHYYYRSMEKL